MKILAIVGSLRKESFNRQLAKIAGELLKDRAEFEILDYNDVPLLNEDIEFPAPESVTRVRKKLMEADGVWFFTPEYNHYFPGVLKNLVDWISRPIEGIEGSILAGKPVAISGITPGISGTALSQDHLVTLLSFLNMNIMNAPRLVIPKAFEQVDENNRLKLDSSMQFLENQVEEFLKFIEKNN